MKIFFTILLLSAPVVRMFAQNNNSPYSVLGIGDLEDSYFNRTSGMANTGIAYRSNRFLINNNPASFSALDNDFFIGEIGGRATLMDYFGSNVEVNQNQSFDITFRKLVLGIKPSKHWGSSVGIMPFSTQNYEFYMPLPVSNAVNEAATQYFQGSGGMYKAYWANSYEFFHHLSIGVDMSYLFGSMEQKIILQDANSNELVSTNNTVGIENFYFDYGMQFYTKLAKKWDISVGATFANNTRMNVQLSQLVLAPDSAQLFQSTYPPGSFTLPSTFGAGLALTYDKKYTFLADYKSQNWSSVKTIDYLNTPFNLSGFNYYLQNSNRFSLGFEMSKKKNVTIGRYNTTIETMFYQAGFYYENTYLNVYGQQIRDIGGSVGLGVNSKRTAFSYTISLQYGIKGVQNVQLVQEKYASLTLAISYRDFWLTKGRKFF